MKPLIRSCNMLTLVVMALSAVGRIGLAIQVNNVDVLEPVIRRSPAYPQNPDDLFGYSVTIHQLVADPSTRAQALEQTRIIVGAPRGSFPGGLTTVTDYFADAINETGLIYVCPLLDSECTGLVGNVSVYSSDEGIANNDITDATATRLPDSFVEGRLFDQAPDAILRSIFLGTNSVVYENKTGQLLGASMYSDGENFIACAPRWITTNYNPANQNDPTALYEQQVRGICYASGRSLTGFTALRACTDTNSGGSSNTMGQGYCLQGTSVTVTNGQYVIGVPGLDENKGAVFTAATDASNRPSNPDGSNPIVFTMGTKAAVNPDDPNGPLIEIEDQYQGFRVATAYITVARGSATADVIVAVPRYDGDTYAGRINVYRNNDFQTIVRSVDAQGSQMGEFFGQAIVAADLNGDDFDEIIVGAPMYTDFDRSMTEIGRVYVFYNDAGTSLFSPILLDGRGAFGRFGFSLVNLGDIDNDGYEDIAVGAPYTRHGVSDIDGNTDTTGSVYIYYGNSNMTEFENQVPFEITAKDMVDNIGSLDQLETFGFSLASGVDVDLNQYNDLAIGAYKSQLAVLLRTLPVADVTISLSASVTEVDSDQRSSFMVTVSGMYTGRGLSGGQDVNFTLTEVVATGQENRIFFTPDDVNSLSGTGTLSFTDTSVTTSEAVTVYVKSDITIANLIISINLLPVERTITNEVTGNQEISDLQPFPLLRQLGDRTVSVSVVDPCNNDGCMSDIVFNPIQPSTITLIAGDIRPPRVNLTYNNALGAEDAFSTRLVITNLDTRAFKGVSLFTSGIRAECNRSDIVNGVVSCPLRNRIRPDGIDLLSELSFTINEGGLMGNEGQFNVDLKIIINTGNAIDTDTPSNNNRSIVFNVVASTAITVFSSLPGVIEYMDTVVSNPTTASDLGQPVELIVNVGNMGPTSIQDATLVIWLPARDTPTGQYNYLYITAVDIDPQSGVKNATCTMNNVDPLNLRTSQTSGRRKRSIGSSISSWKHEKRNAFKSLTRTRRQTTDGTSAVVTFSCFDPEMRTQCTQINCNLRGLPAGSNIVTVTISTRVDGRFFGSLANSRTFNLTAYTTATILDNFFDSNSVLNASAMSKISLRPLMEPVDPEDDTNNLIHVIIWPALGGLIIIIVLAIILYFVGFFRRKKPEEHEAEGDFEVQEKPPVEGKADKPEGEVITGV